jgi:hypothetical protein
MNDEKDQKNAPAQAVKEAASEQTPQWPLSWIDRVHRWMSWLPVPWWLLLLTCSVVMLILEIALLVRDAGTQALTWPIPLGLSVIYAIFPFYVFGFLYFIDARARLAIDRIRPLLDHEQDLERFRFTISNMPALPTAVASVAGLLFFLILRSVAGVTGEVVLSGTTHATRWIRLSEGLILWTFIGVVSYHTVRQLKIINRIYTRHVRIDLLNQSPLYELARIPVYTAISIVIPVSLILVALPQVPSDPVSVSLLLVTLLFNTSIVVAPIYRVHLELDDEKVKRLTLNSSLTDDLMTRFRRSIRSNADEDMPRIKSSLEVLVLEREIIQSAPTWPWPPGSMRSVSAALLLPIVIWVIQQLLRSIFT